MWMLLYIFSSITVQVLCGKLVGDHICLTEESYTVNVTEYYVRNATVRNYQWCLNVPPRCSFYTIKKINGTRIVERNRTRTVEKCCEGFNEQDNECVSLCQNCVNGICYKETCQCSSGYSGKNCDNTCQSGFWGPNCTNQCNCKYQSCNPANGNCKIVDENKNEINSRVKGDYNDETTIKFDSNEAITAKNEIIKLIDIDHKYTTENNKDNSNYVNSFAKNEITTQHNIIEFISNYEFVTNTPSSNDVKTSIVPTSMPKQIMTSTNENALFSNTTDAVKNNLEYTKTTSKTVFQTNIEDDAHFKDNILNENREFFIPVGIKYDQITRPLSQRNTKNTTEFANSDGKKFLIVDNNDNESHISTNSNNLINSVSVSIATTISLILLAVVLLMINKSRRAKENKREEINAKKNVGVSTVSIYTTSIFHTPLPDPPTFENPSYLTPVEYQGGASEPRSFETHVVCNMNKQNQQKQDYRDSVYDHPPSTGSYRAASIIEPLDMDHKPPITPIEPVYDEIPCRGIDANPYCNQPLSLYINTCGRTSF